MPGIPRGLSRSHIKILPTGIAPLRIGRREFLLNLATRYLPWEGKVKSEREQPEETDQPSEPVKESCLMCTLNVASANVRWGPR